MSDVKTKYVKFVEKRNQLVSFIIENLYVKYVNI